MRGFNFFCKKIRIFVLYCCVSLLHYVCLFACFVYGSALGVAGFACRHQIAWAVVASSVVLDEVVALCCFGAAPVALRARYKYLLPKFLGEVSTGWHLFHSSLCAD